MPRPPRNPARGPDTTPKPRPSRGKSGKPAPPPVEGAGGTPETKRSSRGFAEVSAPFLPLPPLPALRQLLLTRHQRGERVTAEPCLRHEVRGSHKLQSKVLPLTLTLSP